MGLLVFVYYQFYNNCTPDGVYLLLIARTTISFVGLLLFMHYQPLE